MPGKIIGSVDVDYDGLIADVKFNRLFLIARKQISRTDIALDRQQLIEKRPLP